MELSYQSTDPAISGIDAYAATVVPERSISEVPSVALLPLPREILSLNLARLIFIRRYPAWPRQERSVVFVGGSMTTLAIASC